MRAELQLHWLQKRANEENHPWGFVLDEQGETPSAAVVGRGRLHFRRGKTGNAPSLDVATFEGKLVVKEAEALRRAIECGIGPGKAYGCGLLTLAPVRS